ncbi:hypothetical protein K2173_023407 [Erythroxylum novogranatense]|uniref:HMA domain-containing protein n=1 Tax=Erythroxylum novogranatense TaxID=1862640 RepID=A0AAV8TVL0_9ROSI|nr:hypothetical protein K2173_023407 [Erythroxylum novogranatense]
MVTFEPGDWVWVHLRKERFPTQRKSKLDPRGVVEIKPCVSFIFVLFNFKSSPRRQVFRGVHHEGCERRVKKSVEGMKGVTQVEVEPKQNKLTVTGYVDPNKVLERVRHRTGKRAELWPYVPYDVVDHPYAPGAYDKKAPPGYVRNVMDDPSAAPLVRASSFEVKTTTAFSDENPNACAVM